VDSDDGCTCSVAGSGLGVSNSVFRVMLSGSGLRTFAITAAPEFFSSRDGLCLPLGVAIHVAIAADGKTLDVLADEPFAYTSNAFQEGQFSSLLAEVGRC
jgi:hypothetical protein